MNDDDSVNSTDRIMKEVEELQNRNPPPSVGLGLLAAGASLPAASAVASPAVATSPRNSQTPMSQQLSRATQAIAASAASRASLAQSESAYQYQMSFPNAPPPFVAPGQDQRQTQQQQQAYWYNFGRQYGNPPPPMMMHNEVHNNNQRMTKEVPNSKEEEKEEESAKPAPPRFGLYKNAPEPKLAVANYPHKLAPLKTGGSGRTAGQPANWDDMYTQLVEYKKQNGNCKIPSADTSKFGNWVKNQRFHLGKARREGKAPPGSKLAQRIAKLDEIQFEWPKSRASIGGGTKSPAKTDQPTTDGDGDQPATNGDAVSQEVAKPAEDTDAPSQDATDAAANSNEAAGAESQTRAETTAPSTEEAGAEPQKATDAAAASAEGSGVESQKDNADTTTTNEAASGEAKQSDESNDTESPDKAGNSAGAAVATGDTAAAQVKVKSEDEVRVRTPAVMIWEGPPQEDLNREGGWPLGWSKKVFQRTSGHSAGDKDRYWFSPGGRKFRSMVQIRNFLDLLDQHNGDEEAAWKERNPGKRSAPTTPKGEGSEAATTSPTPKKPRRRKKANTITVFSTVPNLASALREANPEVPMTEIQDYALTSRYMDEPFDASKLSRKSVNELARAEILITEPSILAKLMESEKVELTRLVWVQSTCAGVDPLFPLPDKDKTPSFLLTRLAGIFGQPIAEWCIGRIISQERNFDLSRRDQAHRSWAGSREVLSYRFMTELTLTILGCGDIGMCIANAAKSFGMTVIGYVREGERKPSPFIDEFVTSLETAINRADYIVSALPSTAETRGLLDDTRLLRHASKAVGGKNPVFINVGRGDIMSSKTVLQALNRGYFRSVVLDVLEKEPLPINSPLWDHPQVILSPHVSGMTRARDVPKLVLENYQRYVSRQPLLHAVDWEKGY